MKRFLSILLITSALFVAGCGCKKKNKAAQQQKECVEQKIVKEEKSATSKEDYSIVA